VPNIPWLTVGMIAAHIHNSRCRWVKSLGARHGINAPQLVNLRRVKRQDLVNALSRSSDGIRADRIRHGSWRSRTAGDLAEFSNGSGSLPELLCCTRGTPSRAIMHGRSSIGKTPPTKGRKRSVAVESIGRLNNVTPNYWTWFIGYYV